MRGSTAGALAALCLPWVHVAAAGLGLARVVCCAAAGSCQLPSVRARRYQGIHLKLSPTPSINVVFISSQKTISFGSMHAAYFRLLCIASVRQSLSSCCFIFLCLFLALVKGQDIVCLWISKWISQCISACYHMLINLSHQY